MKHLGSVAAFVIFITIGTSANAAIFSFDLFDSEYGNERPPNYGIRLDGLYSGTSSDVYTFSFVDVSMSVDSIADTAVLGGTLLGGTNGDGEARDTNWIFDFTYTGLDVDDSDGSWEFVSGTSGGTGSITALLGGGNDVFHLVEHMGSDGFGPDGDGVDCRGDDGPWCGNGWLNHSITPNLGVADWDTTHHLYSSDFLYKGTPVPEPSVIALFAAGLFGLGFARRRKA